MPSTVSTARSGPPCARGGLSPSWIPGERLRWCVCERGGPAGSGVCANVMMKLHVLGAGENAPHRPSGRRRRPP
jgi:hypothetical protein